MNTLSDILNKYVMTWKLIPDGCKLITPTSQLLPVLFQDTPAMLKIALSAEERKGGKLMVWWEGNGAAKILAHDGQAVLIERAVNQKSLVEISKQDDKKATQILCHVANQLHVPRNKPKPRTLTPLIDWFKGLEIAGMKYGGIFSLAIHTAQHLLQSAQDLTVLHGDIHHRNILDFGSQGWLAIDPKGLIGERAFDFANIFCNPDKEIATTNDCFSQRVMLIAELAGLERIRLVQWSFAYAALSAAWHLEDRSDPQLSLAIANIALSELHK